MTDSTSDVTPPPSVKSRSSRRVIVGVVALVAVVLAGVLLLRGCGGSSSGGDASVATTTATEHRTLTVIFRIGKYGDQPGDYTVSGDTCASGAIAAGAQASIIGPDGAVLATATFPAGRVETTNRTSVTACAFTVSFDVPVVASYSVSAPGFGTSPPESLEDFERDGWVIGLKTGYTG